MFESSKDILYYVIAFCVLWFTIFICWLLFQFISIMSKMRRLVKSIQEKVEKVDEIINLVKDKIEHSATYLGVIVEGVGKLVSYFKEKKNQESARLDSRQSRQDEPVKKSKARKIKIVEE